MTVAGRVLDPDGKPVKGAVVDLVTRPRSPRVGASDDIDQHDLLGQGQSDGDGRFQLDSPRTASTRVFEVFAVAAAPGFGLGWAELNPDAEQPVADIRLQPEQVVRVRLVDVTGAPARGVEVIVSGIGRINDKGKIRRGLPRDDQPAGIRVWPRPVKTDDQGRIALSGIGRGAACRSPCERPPLRPPGSRTSIQPRLRPPARPPSRSSRPGSSRAACSPPTPASPIPNAVVSASGLEMNEHARGYFVTKFRADDQGRFAMNPTAAESYTLGAFPTGGEPYLIQQDEFEWTKGAVKATHDIKVRRGVLIRGKVTEEGTGRPLPASSIMFIPVRGDDKVLSGWQAIVASQDDGSFQIAVPPGKGHLLVFGPTGDLRPRRDRLQPALLRSARRAALPRPRHHPLRGQGRRPAARSGRGAAARRDDQGARRGARRPDGHRRLHPHDAPHRAVQPVLARRFPGPDPRRPLRAARPGSRGFHAHLRPRSRARVGRIGRGLRQAGRRGPDHPLAALRPGQGAVRRARRQASRQETAPLRVRRHARPEPYDRKRAAASRPSWRPTRRSSPTSTASTTGTCRAPTPRAASP